MPDTDLEPLTIPLEGDWSIGEVTDKFTLLTQQLARLSESCPSIDPQGGETRGVVEIDLAGITTLDACGCQLLAHFLRALQLSGLCTRISTIPQTFVSQIHLLGFDGAFNLSDRDSGEQV